MSSESGPSSPSTPESSVTQGAAPSDSLAARDDLFPSRGQLFLVAAMVGVTFLGWGSAKLVCNYHPFEAHKPLPVTIEQLSRDPKHAAIEFEHRIAVCDFEGALALSTGQIVEEVNRLRAGASTERCDERRRLAPRVYSFGELLTNGPEGATARVHSHFNDAKESSVVELASERGVWKVRSRRTE